MDLIKYKDASSQGRIMINVYLLRKLVGQIRKDTNGYRYYPKGSATGGEAFVSLEKCKHSLESLESED